MARLVAVALGLVAVANAASVRQTITLITRMHTIRDSLTTLCSGISQTLHFGKFKW